MDPIIMLNAQAAVALLHQLNQRLEEVDTFAEARHLIAQAEDISQPGPYYIEHANLGRGMVNLGLCRETARTRFPQLIEAVEPGEPLFRQACEVFRALRDSSALEVGLVVWGDALVRLQRHVEAWEVFHELHGLRGNDGAAVLALDELVWRSFDLLPENEAFDAVDGLLLLAPTLQFLALEDCRERVIHTIWLRIQVAGDPPFSLRELKIAEAGARWLASRCRAGEVQELPGHHARVYAEALHRGALPTDRFVTADAVLRRALAFYGAHPDGQDPYLYHLRGLMLLGHHRGDTPAQLVSQTLACFEALGEGACSYAATALLVTLAKLAILPISDGKAAARIVPPLEACLAAWDPLRPPSDRAIAVQTLDALRSVAEGLAPNEFLALVRQMATLGEEQRLGAAVILFQAYQTTVDRSILLECYSLLGSLCDGKGVRPDLQAGALVTASGAAALLAINRGAGEPDWYARSIERARRAIDHPALGPTDAPRIRVNLVAAAVSQPEAEVLRQLPELKQFLVEAVALCCADVPPMGFSDPLAKAMSQARRLAQIEGHQADPTWLEPLWAARTSLLAHLDEVPPPARIDAVQALISIAIALDKRHDARDLLELPLAVDHVPAASRAGLHLARARLLLGAQPENAPLDDLRRAVNLARSVASEAIADEPDLRLAGQQVEAAALRNIIWTCEDEKAIAEVRTSFVPYGAMTVPEGADPDIALLTYQVRTDLYVTAILRADDARPSELVAADKALSASLAAGYGNALGEAVAQINRALLRLAPRFPGARPVTAVQGTDAARRGLDLLTEDESADAGTLRVKALSAWAIHASHVDTGSPRLHATALVAPLMWVSTLLGPLAPVDSAARADLLYARGILLWSLYKNADTPGVDEDARHCFREAAALWAGSPVQQARALGNLAVALRGQPEAIEELAAIDARILALPANTEARQLAELRALSGGDPPLAVLRPAIQRAFDAGHYGAVFFTVRPQLHRLYAADAEELLLLALRAAGRLGIAEARVAGRREWSAWFRTVRDHLVDKWLMEQRTSAARALAEIEVPAPVRVALLQRRMALGLPTTRWEDKLAQTVQEGDLRLRAERALDEHIVAVSGDSPPRPTSTAVRIIDGGEWSWLLGPTPRRLAVGTSWLNGLHINPEPWRGWFFDISNWLGALHALNLLGAAFVEATQQESGAAAPHESGLAAARWPAARAALLAIGKEPPSIGYSGGHRFEVLIRKTQQHLRSLGGEGSEADRLLLDARHLVHEAWAARLPYIVSETERALRASTEGLAAPLSLVAAPAWFTLPVELGSSLPPVQWSLDGLPRDAAHFRPGQHLLIVENPLGDLMYTHQERRHLEGLSAALLPGGVRVLVGGDAGVEAVLSALVDRGCGAFHYSGHSVYDLEHQSHGLLLARDAQGQSPEQSTTSPQLLSSEAIRDLDLRHLNLVLLSSCEGGLTDPGDNSGETDSIAAAFLAAGVRHVVAGRWPVRDEATPALVASFYTAWLERLHPAEALKLALQDNRLALEDRVAWQVWTG